MINKAVLVTGGAGYIGSHTVLALQEAGWNAVVLDDLSTGHLDLIPEGVPFYQGDIADREFVRRILREFQCRRVMHFAGSIVVSESVVNPTKYYKNNTIGTAKLLDVCVEENVEQFVFSSTAAVYGNPKESPVAEDAPVAPVNPYGRSKLMSEWMLKDVAKTGSLRFVALRYFNVAGADPKGRSGQWDDDASHLIKRACETALGKRIEISIYGTNYNTPDGTCIRDYVHVSDLADAHIMALAYLENGGESAEVNCGYGQGYSVRQVLNTVCELSGQSLRIESSPRRPGDPAKLIAENSLIKKLFSWQPKHNDLHEIVETALAWEKKINDDI